MKILNGLTKIKLILCIIASVVTQEHRLSRNILEISKQSGILTITIRDSGVMNLNQGDQALILYMTTSNTGRNTLKLRVEGKQCCQKITDEETDCESMYLIGGEMGELKFGDTRNLTLVYPNLYLHDRKGTCKVIISSGRNTMDYNINFDTSLSKGRQPVPPLLSNYLLNKEIKECSSVDENPLNDCLPAICLIKYNGKRNYFNHKTRRCQKVTECLPDKEGDLPDIVYIPQSNSCRKLTFKLTDEDFAWFKEGKKGESLQKINGYPLNIQCHNGVADPSHEWCKCNPGWASASFDTSSFNPDVMTYHMCTIWEGKSNAPSLENANYSELNINMIILVLLLLTLIFLLLLFIIVFYFIKKMRNEDYYI